MAEFRICSVDGCGKPHRSKGLCNAHYQSMLKFGAATARRGYAQRGAAEKYLSDVVLPYDGDECLIWPFTTRRGYAVTRYNSKLSLVSRIICKAAYGDPPSDQHTDAAHSCGNGARGCVAKRHIRWATRKENSQDKIQHGTSLRGEKHNAAKLTEDDVKAILSSDERVTDIARRYGVGTSAICAIRKGRKWGWLKVHSSPSAQL